MSITEVNLAQGFALNQSTVTGQQLLRTLQNLFEGNSEITSKVFDDLNKYCQKVDRQIQLKQDKEIRQEARKMIRDLKQQIKQLQISGNKDMIKSLQSKIEQLEALLNKKSAATIGQSPINLGEDDGFTGLDDVSLDSGDSGEFSAIA